MHTSPMQRSGNEPAAVPLHELRPVRNALAPVACVALLTLALARVGKASTTMARPALGAGVLAYLALLHGSRVTLLGWQYLVCERAPQALPAAHARIHG